MTDAKDAVINKWRTTSSPDFAYFDAVEEQADGFWNDGTLYRRLFDQLDLTTVIEIACGKGRHGARVADLCGTLILTDTSPDAIEACRQRFSNKPNVKCFVVEDGETLPFVADGSASAVFSYDAMVHFEPVTVAAYLREIRRVLRPGGMALLHHSNYSERPDKPFDSAPGWRNYMTSDLFRHFAHRAGLAIEHHQPIDWATPKSDALSLLKRPAA